MSGGDKSTRTRQLASFGLALMGACLVSNTQAAWVVEAGGGVDSRYDDNVQLATNGPEDDAIVTNVGGELRLRRVTERSELAAVMGGSYLMYSNYNGQEDLQNKDLEYGEIRARTNGERTEFGFNGSVRRDVLLRTIDFIVDPLATSSGGQNGGTPSPTELEPPSGPVTNNGSGVDAATVQKQVRRTRTAASPYLNFQLSQRTGIWLGYDYLGLSYSDQSSTGLDDSTTNAVSGGIRTRVSERDAARLSLRAARFDPQSGPDKTDAYDVSVGWERQFSSVLRGGIEVGAQRSERNNHSHTGYLARAFLLRRGENGAFRVSFQHSLTPSGYGDVVEADTADAVYGVAFTDRWGLRLQAHGYRTRTVSDQISTQGNDRDYVDAGPTLTYALTRSLEVGAFYNYRWVDRENEGSGSSNAFGIRIAYQSPHSI